MPELPDVEGFRRELARSLPGRKVRSVDVRDAGVLRNCTPHALSRSLAGRRFGEPRRHGKWLILPTDAPALLVHSGMTGHPYYACGGDGDGDKGYERLVIILDRGELRYAGLRKLRGVWLVPSEDDFAAVMGRQGPDALTLDLRGFRRLLRGHRGRLEADEVRRLHATMRRVLRTAVRHGRVPGPTRWLTGARDGPDPSCPRCGTRLARGGIGGRTTVWCPRCQQQSA